MSEPAAELLGLIGRGDRVEARFSLLIDEHVDRVWSALTAPEWLPQWLAPGSIELRLGGAAKLDFGDSGIVIDSTVTALTPGAVLEYSWSRPGEPVRPVHWSLEPMGPMTRLTLTLTVPASENVARSCAGWAAHLDMLVAALAGIPIKFPFDVFQAARTIYAEKLEVAQATS
jgi:uncharacterized protein YndB with AHSA1/START domain